MTISSSATARSATVGTELPAEQVDITTTLIVTGAIASRDFYPGHHDRDAAVAGGSKDVFMNVMTTLGLVERYVTAWTGPDVLIKSSSVKLGTSNYPGDVMHFTGVVTSAQDTRDGIELTIDVEGRNGRGSHARAEVTVELRTVA